MDRLEPEIEKLPGEESKQSLSPEEPVSGLYEPASQLIGAGEPTLEYAPLGVVTQEVAESDPITGPYVPAGHGNWELDPEVVTK